MGALIFVGMVLTVVPVFSESEGESGIVTDEDALFGESSDDSGGGAVTDDSLFGATADDDTPLVEEITSTTGIQSRLLTSESVEIGGRYGFSASTSWQWNDPSNLAETITSPDGESASVDLGATLFFDGRPSEDFRVFGKASISYPFNDLGEAREFDDVFHVDELFSDFSWNNVVFFRGGKHTINWGVGYFFSPADLLNITEIDPENPEADREGPVSLKSHLPFDAHNIYLYFIADDIEKVGEIGIAAKTELVFGPMELGIGGLYRKDLSPSAMVTVSAPLWDVDFFGEAVVIYDNDRGYYIENAGTGTDIALEAVAYDRDLFFNATAGFSFLHAFDEVDSSLSLAGQYLYNGEGYADSTVLTDISRYQNAIAALIAVDETLDLSDIHFPGMPGRHYAAVSAGWNSLFGSDFSLRAFWIHSFSDMSGYISPSLSFTVFDGMSFTVGMPFRYGDEGDEYTRYVDDEGDYTQGNGDLSLQLSVRLGGGGF